MSSDKLNTTVLTGSTVPNAKMHRSAPISARSVDSSVGPKESGADRKASPQSVEAVAQRLESYLRSVGRSIEFQVDAASGRTVISVRDAESGDLIRQIPNEEVLRLAQMAEDQTIVLLNETA